MYGRWGWDISFTHLDGGITPDRISVGTKPSGTEWAIEDWSSEDTDEGQKISLFIATRAETANFWCPGFPNPIYFKYNMGGFPE